MDNNPAEIRSCLTDKPLQSENEDNLNAKDYANALGQFIKNADTPVTIGIQGGWGSGKTSLITVLQKQLDSDPEHLALCVLVNAWEHSLFHSSDSKADVALSLLNGLATGIKKSVKQVFDSSDKWLDKTSEEVINPQNNKVETAINFITGGLKLLGKVGLQAASNLAGTGDMSHVMKDEEKNVVIPPLAENVHNLRTGLEELIKKITYKNRPVKIVFFIDDLDRVPPPTAIEILDITKNIFDIPDCVFVLAIDYDVVVKGLEEKFGKKDINNEREFRQYFDKIIQIPFTMPMGAYGDNLSRMLEPALERLGYSITADDRPTLGEIANDARLATGGIPRSIKRIINTLSLLQHIANAKGSQFEKIKTRALPKDLEARFIIVAMHINFPEICRKLMEKPNFPEWSTMALDLPWKLKVEDNKKELGALEKAGATKDFFDDDWEKVVYCLCATSDWLKSQAINVSRLLNRLLVVLNNGQEEKKLSEKGLETLESILESIKVVSIDSDSFNMPQFDDKSVKTDRVTMFFARLQDILSQKLPNAVMPKHTKEWAKSGDERRYDITLKNSNIHSAIFIWINDEEEPCIEVDFGATRHGVSTKKADPVIAKFCQGFEYAWDGKDVYIFFNYPMNFEDFTDDKKLQEVAEKAVKLYEVTDAVQKALANV